MTFPKSNVKRTHYRDSFYIKKVAKKKAYYIANKKYQLTHLLENGHLTRNGKRTRAFPHWQKANEKAMKSVSEIGKKLEGIK